LKPPKQKSFLRNIFTGARVYAGEWLGSFTQQMRAAATGLDRYGHLIPQLGPVAAKALGRLCNRTSDGLAILSEKVQGGYRIEDLPAAAQYLPRFYRKIGDLHQTASDYMTPERARALMNHYHSLAGDIRTVAAHVSPALKPTVV
jgi:hypothetical protein